MADETSSTESEMQQVDTSEMDTPQVAADQVSEQTEQPQARAEKEQSAEQLQKELDKLRDQIKKANHEAANYRNANKELSKFKEQIELEKLTEKERLEKQLAQSQAQYEETVRQSQERTVNYEVRLQAARLNIADPSDAVKLLDWSEIEYNDDGSPKNVEELLKDLVKAKPYLVPAPATRQMPSSGGATNPSRSATNAPAQITEEYMSQLTPDQYRALPKEQKDRISEYTIRRGGRR